MTVRNVSGNLNYCLEGYFYFGDRWMQDDTSNYFTPFVCNLWELGVIVNGKVPNPKAINF